MEKVLQTVFERPSTGTVIHAYVPDYYVGAAMMIGFAKHGFRCVQRTTAATDESVDEFADFLELMGVGD